MKSPWAWISNLFTRKGQDPMQVARYVLPYPVAGVNLSPDDILSLATVWACIDAIARGIGQIDWNVFQPTGRGRRELLENDQLTYVLNTRPNPEMTAIGFREALLFMGIPNGNAFAEIVRDGGGRVAQLWPLPTDRVTPRRDPNWGLVYEYRQPNGEIVILEQRQVFHLRGPGLYGLMGDNLIARAAKSMSVAAAQERFTASFFGQGANPGGVLEWPGKLGDEQYKRLQTDFAEKKKGPENAHKPLILESGMKWTATSFDPLKSQLIEGRQFSVEEICRWFGVPPHKVQHLEHATFSNIEHQSIEFVRDAVTPWCVRLQQEADFKLIRQDRAPWKYTEFDTRPLLSGDAKSRADTYAVLRQNGLATANECRALEGLNDCGDDGDVLLVQSNLTTVERIIRPPAPLALPAPAADDDGEDLNPDVDSDTDETEEATDEAEADSIAAGAFTVIVAGAIDRFTRRLANRRADLERRPRTPGTDVDALNNALINAEREKLWPRLVEELQSAQPFALRALRRALVEDDLREAARLVAAGEDPRAAAAKLLPAGCPRPG